MSEATIRAQIKSILQGVTGSGAVHDYMRHTRSDAERLILYTSGGKVNAFEFERISNANERDTTGTARRTYTYQLQGYYTLDDANQSSYLFQALLDASFEAFKSNITLNGTALLSDLISFDQIDYTDIGGTLYHHVTGTFTVYDRSMTP